LKDPNPENPTSSAFESAAASENLAGKKAPDGLISEGGRLTERVNNPSPVEEKVESTDEVVDVDDEKPKALEQKRKTEDDDDLRPEVASEKPEKGSSASLSQPSGAHDSAASHDSTGSHAQSSPPPSSESNPKSSVVEKKEEPHAEKKTPSLSAHSSDHKPEEDPEEAKKTQETV